MSRLALDIRRITPAIGAEIAGVDLSQLDDAHFAALRQAPRVMHRITVQDDRPVFQTETPGRAA